jgi:hypothetical protein
MNLAVQNGLGCLQNEIEKVPDHLSESLLLLESRSDIIFSVTASEVYSDDPLIYPEDGTTRECMSAMLDRFCKTNSRCTNQMEQHVRYDAYRDQIENGKMLMFRIHQ